MSGTADTPSTTVDADGDVRSDQSGKRESVFHRLHTGTGAFDIIGRRKRWYVGFAVIILISLLSLVFRGFHPGIDFTGGTQLQMPNTPTASVSAVEQTFRDAAKQDASSVQTAGTGASTTYVIKSEPLTVQQVGEVKKALFDKFQPKGSDGKPSEQAVSDSAVSGTWGGDITQSALISLAVFLVLVTIFLTLYFERWMAVGALVSLVNDCLVTAGVYSLIGLEVTPASVIGFLTILGFSLYDTVVVFDKVKENTRGLLGLSRRTYGEAANLAVNQTLMRSINTSLVAMLPVLGLLIVGAGLLGVGTLKDLALVQLVGLISGTFSSIFLATPLLVDFKRRERPYRAQEQRVLNRRANIARKLQAGDSAAVESTDPEALDAELRQERAYAAANSVPARPGKGPRERGNRKQSGQRKAGGHSSRPTGKRGR